MAAETSGGSSKQQLEEQLQEQVQQANEAEQDLRERVEAEQFLLGQVEQLKMENQKLQEKLHGSTQQETKRRGLTRSDTEEMNEIVLKQTHITEKNWALESEVRRLEQVLEESRDREEQVQDRMKQEKKDHEEALEKEAQEPAQQKVESLRDLLKGATRKLVIEQGADATKDKEYLEGQVEEIEAECMGLEVEMKTLRNDIERLETRCQKLQGENEDLRLDVEIRCKQNDVSRQEVESLRELVEEEQRARAAERMADDAALSWDADMTPRSLMRGPALLLCDPDSEEDPEDPAGPAATGPDLPLVDCLSQLGRVHRRLQELAAKQSLALGLLSGRGAAVGAAPAAAC